MKYTKLVEVAHSEIASYGCIDSANSQAMIEAIESQAKRIVELEAQRNKDAELIESQALRLGRDAQPAQSVPDGLIVAVRQAEQLNAKSDKLNHDAVLGRAVRPFIAQLLTAAPKPVQQPDSKPVCNHCLQIRHKDCEEWLANLPDGIFATDTWTIARIVWNAALSSKPSEIFAEFYVEVNGLIGTTSVPIKKTRINDDNSITVSLDYWPESKPSAQVPEAVIKRIAEYAVNRGYPLDKLMDEAEKDIAAMLNQFSQENKSQEE